MTNNETGQLSKDRVWQWRYPVLAKDQRRRIAAAGGFLGAGLICLVLGAVSATRGSYDTSRFLIVSGLIFLGLLVLGETATRRARSTVVDLNQMGLLTFTDSRATSSVDLRVSSVPSVRRRSSPTGWHWSIEVDTPEGGWHRQMANTASYFQLATDDAKALELDLQRWSSWARGEQSPTQVLDQQARIMVSDAAASSSTLPSPETPARFHWTPPRHPNAARNQRRLRFGTAGFALLIAAVATISQWKNGLAAVGFSMLTPIIVLLIGAGLDLLFRSGQGFAIDINQGLLTVSPGRGKQITMPLATIRSVSVDSSITSTNSGGSTHRRTIWRLAIHSDQDPSNPDPVLVLIPTGFGSDFSTNEAINLESSLRGFLIQI